MKSMSVRSNSDVSVRCFFGHSLCVMPDALAEPFSHMSLPDLLILMSLGEFAPPVSVFVCFSYVFCGSYLFFSRSYTLCALTNLPSKFGDCSYDTPTFIQLFF